ncbi:MAG: hypothetical protein IPG96_20700 [Proteobacteria bacterium]|nr:hypothetical protein [Pseudomonadota bacterium]
MSPAEQNRIHGAGDQLHRLALLLRRSLRHLWKGLLLTVLGLGVSAAVAFLKPRIYISETVILYRQIIRASYLGGPEGTVEAPSNDVGLRMRELLVARPRLERLIKRHGLYSSIVRRRGYVEAVDRLRTAIEYRVGGGDTFHIAFKGPSAELAQRVTRDLAESLIEEELRLRSEQVNATQHFLEVETNRLQRELQDHERALAQFLAAHPEFAQEQVSGRTALDPGASVRAAQVRQQAEARRGDASVLALRRQAERIRSQLDLGSKVVRLPPDPDLLAAKDAAEEELREARTNLARAQAEFTERHPDVAAAQQRLRTSEGRVERVRRTLAASAAVRRPTTSVDRDALRTELQSIERQSASKASRNDVAGAAPGAARDSESKADRIVALETEWNGLNRRVRDARERYLRLEGQQFRASIEATSELTGQASQLRIIDPPFLPANPSGVGRSAVLAGGAAVSLILGLLLMLALASIDERIYDRADVERSGPLAVLVEVPRLSSRALRDEREA